MCDVRVLRIIDSLGVGGAERLEVTFAAEARFLPMSLTIVALEERPYNLLPELTRLGATVVQMPSPRTRLDRMLQVIRVAALIRRRRIDVVHASLTYANLVAAVAGRLTRTPVICSLHGTAEDSRAQLGIVRIAERWVLGRGATRIVAVGDSVVRSYRDLLGGRAVFTLPNAVPVPPVMSTRERAAVRTSLTRGNEALVIMAVGRVVPDKAYGDLLLAYASLVEQFAGTVLVIVGGGEMEDDLMRMVETLGLTAHVQLLGFRDDVPALLAAADVFVLSSRNEGSPVAVLEAMAAGLPTVATDVGDLSQVVTPDCGVLVPPGRPDLLAAEIAGLLASRQRRELLGAAARRQVEEFHGARAWARSAYDLYREVVTSEYGKNFPTSGRV